MRKPTPEVAYVMALVAAQRTRVQMAKALLSATTTSLEYQLGMEQRHLESLEGNLKRVRRNVDCASEVADMPWRKGK